MTSSDSRMAAVARDHNRRAWNALVQKRQRFTHPVSDDDFADFVAKSTSGGWLPAGVKGLRLLCLAAGGGKHSVLFAAAGAQVTVVDLSPDMLAIDRQVAAERGLTIRTVEASMDDLTALPVAGFDVVIQPVSTCYVPDVVAAYREVARITAPGGIYISQHKQPASLQADVRPSPRGYELIEPYFRSGPLPPVEGSPHREEGTLEFLHRWEELIGGLCRSGFAIEDLMEPPHAKPQSEIGSFAHRSGYVAPYVRIKARRVGKSIDGNVGSKLWTPE